MDSEDEGELYIGCAGGVNTNTKFHYSEEAVSQDICAYKLQITGLKGGHSGIDIPLGRGNSNKLLIRYLWQGIKRHNLRLASIDGGSLRNTIPRESFAVVTVPKSNEKIFLTCVEKFASLISKELSAIEPNMKFEAIPTEMPQSLIDTKTQNNFVKAIYGCPNGVMSMITDMPDVVETSTNLAIIKSKNGIIEICALLRSSVESKKEDLCNMMQCVFELAGAEVEHSGSYPGWKPNVNSPILNTMKEVYNNKFGKIPEVKVIHAGLECGIIGDVYPNLDLISFGPTIRFPHSPDEKVNIKTVEKFWDFLLEALKNIPKK